MSDKLKPVRLKLGRSKARSAATAIKGMLAKRGVAVPDEALEFILQELIDRGHNLEYDIMTCPDALVTWVLEYLEDDK